MKTYILHGKQERYFFQIIEAKNLKEAKKLSKENYWEEGDCPEDPIKIYSIEVKE